MHRKSKYFSFRNCINPLHIWLIASKFGANCSSWCYLSHRIHNFCTCTHITRITVWGHYTVNRNFTALNNMQPLPGPYNLQSVICDLYTWHIARPHFLAPTALGSPWTPHATHTQDLLIHQVFQLSNPLPTRQLLCLPYQGQGGKQRKEWDKAEGWWRCCTPEWQHC